ncbi:hypothetical protein B0H94_11156 [Salsuginibacillus halophilus]|uniref:Uncharacterized protein n=1 Tax=Salsuginibacillus halophilus TaxID=517424 RepID=A0A2P8HAH9_9BACI|nr:hypothetical protein [Salsuginibacillus halophilus]PSL43233.1 hypothetical protein B0H94_11156 [Salsuginibacillus halophilus]
MEELNKEKIKIIAENFAKSYMKGTDDWEQILDYEGEIPKIIREVVNVLDYSFWFEVSDKKGLYKDIMSDINELKQREGQS